MDSSERCRSTWPISASDAPGVQQIGGQGVPQPVRAEPGQPGPPAGTGHDRADRSSGQWSDRGAHGDEHRVRLTPRAGPGQVAGHRGTHRGGQRQPFHPGALAADQHLAVKPVEVVQAERGDLGAPQPEVGQQREHRAVTQTDGVVVSSGHQQRRDLVSGQPPG